MARTGALLIEIFINGQFLQFLISCVQLVVGCHPGRGPGQRSQPRAAALGWSAVQLCLQHNLSQLQYFFFHLNNKIHHDLLLM